MSLFSAFLASCQCTVALPDPEEEEEREDSGRKDTQGETGERVDTGPPPLCGFPETEPNYPVYETLPMETWACGSFGEEGDHDSFRVDVAAGGWYRLVVECENRGSSADPALQVSFDGDEDGNVLAFESYLSEDPGLVFRAESAGSFVFYTYEETKLYGEDYTWYLLFSETKQPVTWDVSETEPDDDMGTANSVTLPSVYWARIDEPADEDWYHVTVPTPAEGNTIAVDADVTAFTEGSYANLTLDFYDVNGTLLSTKYAGDNDYDLDAHATKKLDPGEYWIRAYDASQNFGGMFYWYTLSLSLVEESA
jgi:hypothetical protein